MSFRLFGGTLERKERRALCFGDACQMRDVQTLIMAVLQ